MAKCIIWSIAQHATRIRTRCCLSGRTRNKCFCAIPSDNEEGNENRIICGNGTQTHTHRDIYRVNWDICFGNTLAPLYYAISLFGQVIRVITVCYFLACDVFLATKYFKVAIFIYTQIYARPCK